MFSLTTGINIISLTLSCFVYYIYFLNALLMLCVMYGWCVTSSSSRRHEITKHLRNCLIPSFLVARNLFLAEIYKYNLRTEVYKNL